MTDASVVVQTLRELGLTRTEADVYLATLREANGEPVSGYRVAQSVGKDPANLSKTLASLERLGAVRTIQEKPRLYIPISPAEFTDKLIAHMKDNRLRVLDQLTDLEKGPIRGVPMALNNREQALNKTAQLLTGCRRELLLFADRGVLESLGTALEALAASSEVTVNLLCLEKLELPGINEKVIELPIGFADPHPVPWLQLVIDRQTWLTASFPSTGAGKLPCGWWSEDPALALVMGAGLAAAMESSVEVAIEIPPIETVAAEPEAEIQMVTANSSPVPETENLTEMENEPQPVVRNKPKNLDDAEADEGIQFIMRHENDENSDPESP